jgi:ATP-binding cassette subfamily C exporter for protease/lipase
LKNLGKFELIRNGKIFQSAHEFKPLLVYLALFTACINILYIAPSIYMLEVYDRVLTSSNLATLFFLTIIVVGLYIVMSALEFIRSGIVIKAGEKIDNKLNQQVFTAAFYQNLKSKKVNAGQALADLTIIRQFITGNGLFAFFDAPWFPFYLLLNFLFDFWIGLFTTFSVLLLVLLAWINDKATSQSLQEASEYSNKSMATASNNLRHAETIHAMGMLGSMRARWFKSHQKFLDVQAIASMRASHVASISKFFRLVMQSLILGLGAWLAINHEISSGMMIAGSILLGRALAPVDLIISVWKQWGSVVAAYDRLEKLLAENAVKDSTFKLPRPVGNLALEEVYIRFETAEQYTLKNISLYLSSGECLAIIGQSGAGKSTLGKSIVGLIVPLAGKVRMDGADIYSWDREELGKYTGYLSQQPILFAGTIAENICRFGKLDSEKIIKAATIAGVHELILRLPKGYETEIGDGGMGLSGGEIQRIALSQSLYGDPSLVVLDEPSSNLDQAGEAGFIETLAKLKSTGQTVVYITHSVKLIGYSDKLLLLENGTIKAFDTTQNVINQMSSRDSNLPRMNNE